MTILYFKELKFLNSLLNEPPFVSAMVLSSKRDFSSGLISLVGSESLGKASITEI